MFFTSKKDIFYFLIIWGSVAFVSLSVIFDFSLNILSIFGDILGLSVVEFLIWIWFGTSYRVKNKYIAIKYGPFKEKISIQDINRIGKKKSILVAPALAIDKVLLRYGKYGEILLSPKKEKEFINLLLIKNPQIILEKPLSKT